jgi:DNA-directed RNA polymerase subunit K/omega
MAKASEKKIIDQAGLANNKFVTAIAASKRARQLLDKADRHNVAVDIERVHRQACKELMNGKLTYVLVQYQKTQNQ